MNTRRVKSALWVGAVLAVLVGLTVPALRRAFQPEPGVLQVNGRIESDKVTLASKVMGRVSAIRVREGDSVRAQEALALLDDRTTQAQLAEAQAAAEAARSQVGSERSALAVLRTQVPHAIASAQAGVAAAEASLRQAQSTARQAQLDADRAQRLVTDHLIDTQSAQRAVLAWNVAQEQLAASVAESEKAQQALLDARVGPIRIQAQEASIAALQAALKQAEAHIREIQTVLDESTIISPVSATVTERFVNVGEIVNIGTPVYELVDLDALYLQVYVPEAEIGKIRRGLPARIYTDAFPNRQFSATVRYIASRAEFTPKEVQTPDERVKLVYQVRLYLDENPRHALTPGLPCDAVIRWRDDAAWTRPKG